MSWLCVPMGWSERVPCLCSACCVVPGLEWENLVICAHLPTREWENTATIWALQPQQVLKLLAPFCANKAGKGCPIWSHQPVLSKLCGEGGSGVTRPPSPEVSPPSFALQPMIQDEQVDLPHVVWALFKLLFSLLDLMESETTCKPVMRGIWFL